MTRPDFRDFQGKGLQMLAHSAKGTTWKDHKYIKKEGDRYIYAPKGGSGRRREGVGELSKANKENDEKIKSEEETNQERIKLIEELMEKDKIGVNEANEMVNDFLNSMKESTDNTDKEIYEIMRKLVSFADGK